MFKEEYCECEEWLYYIRNYYETFYWIDASKKWYVTWVHLSDQGGYTQVSRYAIPIKYCPLCGKKLKKFEDINFN